MSEYSHESESIWDGSIPPSEIDGKMIFTAIQAARPWKLKAVVDQAFSATYTSFDWIDNVDTEYKVTVEEQSMDFSQSIDSSKKFGESFDLIRKMSSVHQLGARAVRLIRPQLAGIVRVTRSDATDIGTDIHYSHRYGRSGKIDKITADPASIAQPEELERIISNITIATKEIPIINTPLAVLTQAMSLHYGLQREISETKKTFSSAPIIEEKRVITPLQHSWNFGNKVVSVVYVDDEHKKIFRIGVVEETDENFVYNDYEMIYLKGCEYFAKTSSGNVGEKPRYFDRWNRANIMTADEAAAIQSLFQEP